MVYKIEFTCGIRGHHVYKTNWILVLIEKLDCKKDNREEALSYDEHPVGVFISFQLWLSGPENEKLDL